MTAGLPDDPVARAVAEGLTRPAKALPPWLFYDAAGSRLFEQITELPEYYLTRAEREIFDAHAATIIAEAMGRGEGPLTVVELGAGTATKTQVLLDAVVQVQPGTRYIPVDVSGPPLRAAALRLGRELPELLVSPCVSHNDTFLSAFAGAPGRRLVLFIGSSIGNLDPPEAASLLAAVRGALGPGGALLLGTDLRKSPAVMLPAYDDSAGVTAAFNRNVLVRINRELGGAFEPATFVHRATWNAPRSRMEMHLESTRTQRVPIRALGLDVPFSARERIHTESSAKYDLPAVDEMLQAAGLARVRTWMDTGERFAVHLAG